MSQDSDATFRALFDDVCNSPDAWSDKALALLLSADTLRRSYNRKPKSNSSSVAYALHRMNMQHVFVMLRGMGVECLLKAAWVKHVGSLSEGGNFQSPKPKLTPHDLVPLEERLNEHVTTGINHSEKMVLTRLSMQIENGRYPTPARFRKSPTLPAGSSGHPYLMAWRKVDERNFKSLVGKLDKLLLE